MLPHAYVTGTVPDEGCVVWGNVGERDRAREAGLHVLLKATARLLYELLFLWAVTCMCFSLCKYSTCKFACVHVYVEENVFKCVCTLCSSLYTVCMYPPLKPTNTHCLIFWALGQNWASYCYLVCTNQNHFSHSTSLLPLLSIWSIACQR